MERRDAVGALSGPTRKAGGGRGGSLPGIHSSKSLGSNGFLGKHPRAVSVPLMGERVFPAAVTSAARVDHDHRLTSTGNTDLKGLPPHHGEALHYFATAPRV